MGVSDFPDSWSSLWNRRGLEPSSLKELSGFAGGMSELSDSDLKSIVADPHKRTHSNCQNNDFQVIEIGSGAGRFALFWSKECPRRYTGIDPSASLIARARDVDKAGIEFLVGKSSMLSKYDYADLIIFHSVLQYFEKERELDEAISFSEAALRKNSGHLALLDVPDLSKKDEFLEIRKRYKMPDVSEKGELSHSFYDSDILKEKLANSGFRDVQFFPHDTKGYGNAYYRFNRLAKL